MWTWSKSVKWGIPSICTLGRRARSKTSSCLGIINWPFFPPLLARSPLDFFEKSFYWLATWKSLTMSLRLLPLKLELLQKTDCVLFIHSSLLELCQSKNCQGENIDVLNSSPLSHIPKVGLFSTLSTESGTISEKQDELSWLSRKIISWLEKNHVSHRHSTHE